MKKIGFIDHYLHEWHAENYPEMIKKYSGGKMEVCFAYGETDNPHPEADSNAVWAKRKGIELVGSIEEVIEKSDYVIVLSPDNPERHEELCKLPTACGKRVYIDKTFAPDKETAIKIFERAEKYSTPCYSSSALNFAAEYQEIDRSRIETVGTWGEGAFTNYAIHQIEPIVSLMGIGAKRVMFMGSETFPSLYIEYADGRHAQLACYPRRTPFMTNVGYHGGTTDHLEIKTGYFDNFIKALVRFFETGEIPVSHEQTIEVIAIREAGMKAMLTPFEWVNV